MTQFDWNPDKGEATFETSLISGIVIADGNRFTLSNLIWKPGDVQIDRGMALAPYRLLARSSWMGEVREMSHSVRPIDDGLVVRFEPTHDHRATLTCMVRITDRKSVV